MLDGVESMEKGASNWQQAHYKAQMVKKACVGKLLKK